MKLLKILPLVVSMNLIGVSLSAQWVNTGADGVYTGRKVGMNVNPPLFPLHVNGGILSTGTGAISTISGPGTRFMWNSRKQAFRGGIAVDTEWDDVNVGVGSFAFGYSVKAEGPYAFAMGEDCTSFGGYSVAWGIGNYASHPLSVAIGNRCTSSGISSLALGDHCMASDISSIAIGAYNTSTGYSSIAMGNESLALNHSATAIGNNVTASGRDSFAAGFLVAASGKNAMILGSSHDTGGMFTNNVDYSLMVGFKTQAGPALFVGPGNGESGGTFGRVGIGTASPRSELSVNGRITAKEITLIASGWPDYVFSPTHERLSLQETDQYIQTHHHLPGVPAAAEVEANGLNVAEMNQIMMEKIEELTLHLIEVKKENDALKKDAEGNRIMMEKLEELMPYLIELKKEND